MINQKMNDVYDHKSKRSLKSYLSADDVSKDFQSHSLNCGWLTFTNSSFSMRDFSSENLPILNNDGVAVTRGVANRIKSRKQQRTSRDEYYNEVCIIRGAAENIVA